MKNVVAAALAGSLVLAIAAGAQANKLDGASLGEDWLMAAVEEQSRVDATHGGNFQQGRDICQCTRGLPRRHLGHH